jgi:hypothetical protein
MVEMHQVFGLNDDITAKIMDGEAIIINLANGTYYSMDGVGAEIWKWINLEMSLEECAAQITSLYDVEPEKAQADVMRLVEELLAENIIKEITVEHQNSDPSEKGLQYESPKLNIFRDMGDLLALDPPTPGVGEMPWQTKDEKD